MMRSLQLFVLLFCGIASEAISQAGNFLITQRSAVFDSTDLFASCHASTLVSLEKGLLMSAWFGGSAEGKNDVCIWGAFSQQRKWGAPKLLVSGKQADGKQFPCWNPVLFKARNGVLYLHYKVGPNPREWWALYIQSADNGKTWSKPIRLPKGMLGPIRNKPIQLPSGEILYPSSTESLDGKWDVHMEISDESLTNWKNYPVPGDKYGVIQPTILQYPEGKLQILCRSRQNVITESWSVDGGTTWEPMQPIALPNPNSGIDAVSLQDGRQLLVYNPLTAGKEWWEGRSVLKLAVSADGHNWKEICTLEDHTSGEYSYPAIIQDREGAIHITYTNQRKKIQYVRLDPGF